MSVAVFVNPHSRSNRRDPTFVSRLADIVAGAGKVIAPASLEALDEETRALVAAPPSVIAVHGGDGTLHRTVASLLRAFAGRPLPPLAILAGGTMNVVAASLRVRARPERLLAQVTDDVREGRAPLTVPRRCVQVGDSYGFVFGNGLMSNFLQEYYARGGYGPRRAVWILGRTVTSALYSGEYAQRIFRRFSGTVTVDGHMLPWRTFTGLGIATVREVGLGFKLHHRADDDLDRFAVLAIHAGPLALALDVPAVHEGRGIAPERAWSAVGSEVIIEPEPPPPSGTDATDEADTMYTIDGDLYRARGRLVVRIGPLLEFVRPR